MDLCTVHYVQASLHIVHDLKIATTGIFWDSRRLQADLVFWCTCSLCN